MINDHKIGYFIRFFHRDKQSLPIYTPFTCFTLSVFADMSSSICSLFIKAKMMLQILNKRPNTSLEPTAWIPFGLRYGLVVRRAMSSRGSALGR
jgi:hypothetical protein